MNQSSHSRIREDKARAVHLYRGNVFIYEETDLLNQKILVYLCYTIYLDNPCERVQI